MLYPGAHVDWNAADLDRLAATIGLPLGADSYAAGSDDVHYCFDTDGDVSQVTAAGARRGSACPAS